MVTNRKFIFAIHHFICIDFTKVTIVNFVNFRLFCFFCIFCNSVCKFCNSCNYILYSSNNTDNGVIRFRLNKIFCKKCIDMDLCGNTCGCSSSYSISAKPSGQRKPYCCNTKRCFNSVNLMTYLDYIIPYKTLPQFGKFDDIFWLHNLMTLPHTIFTVFLYLYYALFFYPLYIYFLFQLVVCCVFSFNS